MTWQRKVNCVFNKFYFVTEAQIIIPIMTPVPLARCVKLSKVRRAVAQEASKKREIEGFIIQLTGPKNRMENNRGLISIWLRIKINGCRFNPRPCQHFFNPRFKNNNLVYSFRVKVICSVCFELIAINRQ